MLGSQSKVLRILQLYERLCQGEVINRYKVAEEFGVDPKTIYRDLNELKIFVESTHALAQGSLEHDRSLAGYVLRRSGGSWFHEQQVLAIAKVLLESRAFPKEEMNLLIDKLVLHCTPETRTFVKDLIRNEQYHYVNLRHGQPLFKIIWELSVAIHEQKVTELTYFRESKKLPISRVVKPLGIIFSEFYFYLLAELEEFDFDFPTVYRLDRILDYQVTDQRFRIEYASRFEEGEFRKQVQFMQTGALIKVRFKFWGVSIDAILDRLPTARILKQEGEIYLVEAETFGRGILMWLLSQGPCVEVLQPRDFREEMQKSIQEMLKIYQS